jgi:undecaprenyl-diphosphatase
MEKWLTPRTTVFLVGALTLWRLYLSATLQLHPDEAYYWLWSRNLDISYFDHPPMVAVFIWLTTLFSQTEVWVRLSGQLVFVLASGLLWRLAWQWSGSVAVAAGSVILLNVYPLTMLGLTVMTPDVPVFLFWALGVSLFWQILRSGQAWLWYPLGGVFGLALASKYTAVLMAPCIFLYLLLTPERRWLKTVHPYGALLLGCLCFLPVLVWNSQHDWVSFTFQFRNGLNSQVYSLGHVVEYLAGQMLITSPIAWVLGVYVALLALVRKDRPTLLLVCLSLPVIAFFGVSSLKKVAGANWPAFAYFTLSALVARYCLGDHSTRARRVAWLLAAASGLALSMLLTAHARFNVIPLARYSEAAATADATNGFHGWKELTDALQQYPAHRYVVTPSHQLSAEVMYYSGGNLPARTARMTRPSQFNLWDWTQDMQGTDGLYLWSDGDFIGHEGARFAAPSVSTAIDVHRDGKPIRRYHLIPGGATQTPPFPGN